MKHQKKFKEPKDTMWGKCLSTFIAIVFAVSTLTIIPIAGAISGASTGATSEEMAALEAEKSTKQAEDEAAAISAANDKLSIDDIEDESKKDVSTDVVDTVLGTQDADADATDRADVEAKCDCTGEVHAKDCKAGLTGPIEIEATEPVVDETLITPAAEPEAPVWQLPDGEKRIASYTYCSSQKLPANVTISTGITLALGTEDGMSISGLVSDAGLMTQTNEKGENFTFVRAEVQNASNGQAAHDDKSTDIKSMYGTGAKATTLRYNQNENTWQYKTDSSDWVAISANQYVTLYYQQEFSLNEGKILFNANEFGYLSPSTGYTAAKSGRGVAVIQLYGVNGKKLSENYLPVYYSSYYANKDGNSLSFAERWNVERVALRGVANKGGKIKSGEKEDVSGLIPSNFDSFDTILPEEQKNDFTIPFYDSWKVTHGEEPDIKKRNQDYKAGDINVYIIGVQVSAELSEQDLKINYLDNTPNPDGTYRQIAKPQGAKAKGKDGDANPVWKDFIVVDSEGKATAKENGSSEVVEIPVSIVDNAKETLSLKLTDSTGYKSANHVRAEIVGTDLNLYFEPQDDFVVQYVDGVDGDAFETQTYKNILYNRATPAFNGTPTREGYLFTGWDPKVADTVTGNVTYTATWKELYTVTYTDGVESEEVFADQVFDKLLKATATPTIADPTRYGYVFAGWNPAVADKVSGNATYTAKWYEDKIDKDNPEKEGPDGIPDIYQKRVTFKVVNGNWNDDTNANTVHVLTFYKDGELSTDAAATAAMPAAPAVGNKPAAGYFSGYRAESWHAVVPTGDVTRTTVLDEYTYTYPAAYTVTYADGANGSVFTSQVAGNLLFDEATPAFKDDVNSLKRAGYVFAGWDKEIAPTVKGNITYTATWDEDVLGNDPSNPGNTDYSDGIADKYQTIVTFAGVGGTVNGKTQFDYVVTLKDAAGNNAIDGTYKLTEADVPTTAAAAGYAGDPAWTVQNPFGVEIEKPGATFIANWGNGFVAYYYDGVLGSAVDANVGVDQTIVVDAAQATTFEGHNYVLDRVDNNNSVVVAGDPGQNVVSVYYDLDEIGNDPDPANSGNIDYSDGVADKYQIVVSYAAVNGTINGIPRVVLDKFDADGKHAVDGTAVLAANQIPGTAPNAGFGPEGTWTPNVPVTDMQLTENTDFVITYAATPTEPTNPEEPTPGPTPGPGPDEPNPPVNPEEPTPTPTPTPTPEPTPGPEGPIAAVVAPPVVAAVTEGVAGAVEAIGDGLNPLAAITAPEAIDDDANALVAFEDIHCWTHWLMIFGALVTIVYGLGVLYMRRRAIHDFDDFEDNASGRKYDAAAEKNPATGNAFQAM